MRKVYEINKIMSKEQMNVLLEFKTLSYNTFLLQGIEKEKGVESSLFFALFFLIEEIFTDWERNRNIQVQKCQQSPIRFNPKTTLRHIIKLSKTKEDPKGIMRKEANN